MCKSLIAFGVIALFAISPAASDPRSHIIGNDDEPVSRATDAVVSGSGRASYVMTLSYAPRGSRIISSQSHALAPGMSHVIGNDDQPVSRATDVVR